MLLLAGLAAQPQADLDGRYCALDDLVVIELLERLDGPPFDHRQRGNHELVAAV